MHVSSLGFVNPVGQAPARWNPSLRTHLPPNTPRPAIFHHFHSLRAPIAGQSRFVPGDQRLGAISSSHHWRSTSFDEADMLSAESEFDVSIPLFETKALETKDVDREPTWSDVDGDPSDRQSQRSGAKTLLERLQPWRSPRPPSDVYEPEAHPVDTALSESRGERRSRSHRSRLGMVADIQDRMPWKRQAAHDNRPEANSDRLDVDGELIVALEPPPEKDLRQLMKSLRTVEEVFGEPNTAETLGVTNHHDQAGVLSSGLTQSLNPEQALLYNNLKDLRETEFEERFEKLDAIEASDRQRLFGVGEEAYPLMNHLALAHNWQEFELDKGGVAGIYPYGLLARLPYMLNSDQADLEQVEKWKSLLEQAGFSMSTIKDVKLSESKETQRAVILQREQDVIVIFRGTQFDRDWEENINLWPKQGDEAGLDASFHAGYVELFGSLLPQLQAILSEKSDETADPLRFYIVGHSMGGVLAQLLGLWLEQQRSESGRVAGEARGVSEAQRESLPIPQETAVKKVITLGSVRAFGDKAAEAYQALGLGDVTTRVVNYADVVPQAWPNWKHPPSKQLFFTKNGKYWLDPDSVAVLFNQLRRFSFNEVYVYRDSRTVRDHDLTSYIKLLLTHSMDTHDSIDMT